MLSNMNTINAVVVELVDTQHSKCCEVTFVWVRVPPTAPLTIIYVVHLSVSEVDVLFLLLKTVSIILAQFIFLSLSKCA